MMEELYDIDADGRFQLQPTLRAGRKPYEPMPETQSAASQTDRSVGRVGLRTATRVTSPADEKGAVEHKTVPPEPLPTSPASAPPEEPALASPESAQDWTTDDADLEQIEEFIEPAEIVEAAPRDLSPIQDIEEAYALLEAANNRDELGDILVRVALAKGGRALLFTRTADNWTGWTGAGPGVQTEYISALMFPSEPGTCFGLVGSTGAQFLGPLQPHPTHERLLNSLGCQKPRSVGLFPVHYRGKVVFGIYLDAGNDNYLNPDIADILLLAQRVPITLERLIQAKQARQKT